MFKYLFFRALNLKWFFMALAVMITISALPPMEGLDAKGMAMIGITVMAIILFVSASIPLPATALLIAFFQVFFGIGKPNQVAKSFTGDALFFIIGILLIANVLIQQRIDKRLSKILLRFTGSSINKLVIGIMFLCAVLAATIGEHTAAALLYPVVLSLILSVKMDDHNKSRFAKLLLFALAYSGMVGGMSTPSGGGRNPLMIEYLYRLAGIKISYMQWVVMALPVAFVLLPVLYFILRGTFRLKTKTFSIDKDDSGDNKLSDMSGRLSPKEKLTIGVFVFILSLWIFASDKLGMGIIALLGVFLYLIFGLAEWRDISSKTNWGIILIYASALSLGLAMKHTGVTEWFAHVITNTLYNLNIGYKPAVLVSIGGISALMSNVLSHGPSVAVSGPIFLKLAEVMRMNVLVVGLVNVMTASFGFLTIIAAPTNSLIFTSGFIKTSDYLKAGWFATIAAVIVTTVFSLLYWNILGYTL